MSYEHESGLPLAFSRGKGKQEVQSVVFHGRRALIQGAELNDLQDAIRGRHDRLGRLVADDGNRTEGAIAVVDRDAGTVTLTSGKIYVSGDEFPVGKTVLTGVSMVGSVEIGVRLVRSYITDEDDPSLRGQVPGSWAEGEESAAREIARISWATSKDGGAGDFHQVYLLQDGTILDQKPPASLDPMMQALALYDRPHGHYIVSGHRVTALGANAGKQVFSIEEGEANIGGFKIIRHAALRHAELEDWDVGAVPGETHNYVGGASQEITVDRFPIDNVSSILLTKERTVQLTRGALANGIDGLPENSVIEIVRVFQGGTDFVQGAGASFIRTGNGVDWGGPGPEPAVGSMYQATIRWRASVAADSVTDRKVVVSGGASGGEIIVAYTYKLPRVDILGILPNGAPAYVRGVSALANPVMPLPPANVLPLCTIHNSWMGTPRLVSDGVRTGVQMPTWAQYARLQNAVEDLTRLQMLGRLRAEVDQRDPAAKRNMFVDPFTSDYYRDAGIPQTGAVGNGILQLAIVPTFYDADLVEAVTLDWVEEIIVEQLLKSGCEKINPYANFLPLPGDLRLTPAVDFWTEPGAAEFASPVTLEFQRGLQSWGGPLTTQETAIDKIGVRETALPFLRQRSVAFTVSGLAAGELLTSLTFDGVNVLPAGLAAADASGQISGSFTVPAGVTAGTKTVRAVGAQDRIAETLFTGQGTLSVDVMRRVTTINSWSAPQWQASDSDGGSSATGQGSADPQAQNFMLPTGRQLLGLDFDLCVIGDRNNNILVHQVTVENGDPTTTIMGEAFVPMIDAVEGWKAARYRLPVTTPGDRDHSMVIKTDDQDHAISIATVGGFDADRQQSITVNPYPIGPRLSSANARAWTVHQGSAIKFRLIAARYPVTTKIVQLGSFDLVEASDLQVRAVVELPTAACSVVFEIERTNGTVYRLLPLQVVQLSEYITETVKLRAVLTGTATFSPVLYAPVELVAGKIANSATYVSRAFDLAGAVRISAYLKEALPSESTAIVSYSVDGGGFVPLPLTATEISPDPAWVEQNYRQAGLSGQQMRVKIELTGGPSARPRAADFGVGMM